MYFHYNIKFNYTLYIGFPSTHFSGYCQDKNDSKKWLNGGYTSGFSVFQCYDSCKIRHDCVAFTYGNSRRACVLYVDGPYTHGSGYSGVTCYIMQGKNLFFLTRKLKKCNKN